MATPQEKQFQEGVAVNARRAITVQGKGLKQDARALPFRRGKVLAADGTGVYTVGIMGAGGGQVAEIPGVRVWGDATFTVGAKVLLMWEGNSPVPSIVGGGGGSGVGNGLPNGNRFFSA